jgi:hypothetical protein
MGDRFCRKVEVVRGGALNSTYRVDLFRSRTGDLSWISEIANIAEIRECIKSNLPTTPEVIGDFCLQLATRREPR